MVFHTSFRSSPARVVMSRWKNCRWTPAYQPPLCNPSQVKEHVRDNSSILTGSRKNLSFADPGNRRFLSRISRDLANDENKVIENKESPGSGKKSGDENGLSYSERIFVCCAMAPILGYMIGEVIGSNERRKTSFEEFRSMLLEPGLVNNIVVSGDFAVVNLKTSSKDGKKFAHYQPAENGLYILNIQNLTCFKAELEEAQEALGIAPLHYIPVTDVTPKPKPMTTYPRLGPMQRPQ